MGNSAWAGNVGVATIPIFWNMATAEPDVIGQGTWSRIVDTAFLYNEQFFNTTDNDGDNFTMNFRCPAGTYTLRFNAPKFSSAGILDIDIDASEEGSFDLYAAVRDTLNIEEITGLTLSAGSHTLKFRIDGKNGASTDHIITLSGIYLQRTA